MVTDSAVGAADASALHMKDHIIASMLNDRSGLVLLEIDVAHRDAAVVDHGRRGFGACAKCENRHGQHRQGDADGSLFHETFPSGLGETLAETGPWTRAWAA